MPPHGPWTSNIIIKCHLMDFEYFGMQPNGIRMFLNVTWWSLNIPTAPHPRYPKSDRSEPPHADSWERLSPRLLMGLGYIDETPFTEHPRGKAILQYFSGCWASDSILVVHNRADNQNSFEEACPTHPKTHH